VTNSKEQDNQRRDKNGANKKSRRWISSFGFAFEGIWRTAARERNFRIQMVIGILAILACIIFKVHAWHFALVAFAIVFVLSMELMNTAVEALTDLICGDTISPLAKIAKDAAAGAVLLASGFAVVIGIIVAVDVIQRFI